MGNVLHGGRWGRLQGSYKVHYLVEKEETEKGFICLCLMLVSPGNEVGQGQLCKGRIYSCFEKGCPTTPYATMPKGIMCNGGSWALIEALGVSAT